MSPQEIEDRALPQMADAELIILGAVLIDNRLFRQTKPLGVADFYNPRHRQIFEAMLELDEESLPLEPVLIGEILARKGQLEIFGGVAAIAALTYGLPRFSGIGIYVRKVKEKSSYRTAIKKLSVLQADLAEEAITLKEFCRRLTSLENELRNDFAEQTDSFRPLKDVLETDVLPTLEAYFKRETSEFLISTGFPEIDDALGGGLYLSDMMAVVAPPKSAKSAFALQLGLNIARRGEMVALLSLEMSNLQNGLRFIAQKSYADSIAENGTIDDALNAGWLRPGIYESTYRHAVSTAKSLFDANLLLCQKPLDWRELQAETRRLVREKNLRVLIVDYWQLVANSRRGQTRAESLAEIAKGLKQLGQELKICIIALGQFNQEGLKLRSKGEELSHTYLEGSGELAKSANIVLTIDIKDADLKDANAPRKGTLTFRPLRSAADARFDCLFFGKYLTVEIGS